uniref:Uncharacterized protein n=1 Tax=Trichuris muris TaxID=70415 RepID=A0A5S6QB22_TRIMR
MLIGAKRPGESIVSSAAKPEKSSQFGAHTRTHVRTQNLVGILKAINMLAHALAGDEQLLKQTAIRCNKRCILDLCHYIPFPEASSAETLQPLRQHVSRKATFYSTCISKDRIAAT